MKAKNQTIQAEQGGFLRPAAACQYLGISARCLSQWQARRVIPFVKMGKKCVLFKKADLDSALNRFRVAAVGESLDGAR